MRMVNTWLRTCGASPVQPGMQWCLMRLWMWCLRRFSALQKRSVAFPLSPPSLAPSASHTLQSLTDLDDRATVLSNDVIGAFDLTTWDLGGGRRDVLGQHQAHRSVQSYFGAGESLFAFHNGITLCLSLSELAISIICCGTNCGITVGSKSTMGHKSGTVADSSHLVTPHCLKLHAWRTQR